MKKGYKDKNFVISVLSLVVSILSFISIIVIAVFTVVYTSPQLFQPHLEVSTYVVNNYLAIRVYNLGLGTGIISAVGYCDWDNYKKQCKDVCNNKEISCYMSNSTGKFIFFNNFEALQNDESQEYLLIQNFSVLTTSIFNKAVLICQLDKSILNRCRAYPFSGNLNSFPQYLKSISAISGEYANFPFFLKESFPVDFKSYWQVNNIPALVMSKEIK
ncbi:Uncharacterised protein [uncultured archaeon]|nr:Uncharacterised protein [uncultured archaeon]